MTAEEVVEETTEQIGEVVNVFAPGSAVEWKGETFAIAEEVGVMSRIWFGKLASEGTDSDELEGLAAMSDMLEDSLADGEYPRFRAHARKVKASTAEILNLCRDTMAALAQRPTLRPSDSSDGPVAASETSSDDPVARVIARIPETRPDLRLIVAQGAQARAASAASA
jgi:hypothetical protein